MCEQELIQPETQHNKNDFDQAEETHGQFLCAASRRVMRISSRTTSSRSVFTCCINVVTCSGLASSGRSSVQYSAAAREKFSNASRDCCCIPCTVCTMCSAAMSPVT